MSLRQRLSELVRAAFTGIYVESHEHEDALTEIAALCRDEGWALATWDLDRGLAVAGQAAPGTSDPVSAIRSVNALVASGGEDGQATGRPSSALLVLPNFHRLMNSPEVVQALAHQLHRGKENRTFVLLLAPVVQLPPELERQFVLVEHELPAREQLLAIARGVATEAGELPADAEDQERLLDAAAGLTRHEAESAFSLSLVRHGRLIPDSVWELKAQALVKGGLLRLHRGSERFADLGGLEAVKAFCAKALASRHAAARPRGILLLGVPGTGKSAFAKALGNETGRPTLVLDVGALMGSLVGETEARTRQALRTVDAMGRSVLFIDEVEKAFAGVTSGAAGDSGVSARQFGGFLTWLSDHTSEAFVVCTANDIARLPPEFARAERFDAVFFLDLPAAMEREAIWRLYRRQFGIADDQPQPHDADWTGAEVRSCCRLAALLDVPLARAAEQVVPVAATAAESVRRLRTWAARRCLDASRGGLYAPRPGHATQAAAGGNSVPVRRVDRGNAGRN